MADFTTIHASCVSVGWRGVLLAGASGVGKSDLALRLMDRGGSLVSDDQTALRVENNRLIAFPPPSIAGMMEIRHIGLMKMPFLTQSTVSLYVELTSLDAALERMPDADSVEIQGCRIRRVALPGLAASTPAKIRAILESMDADGRNADATDG